MTAYSLNDAQSQLADLIADAMQGKTILIQGKGEKVVQLVPVRQTNKPRQAGSARGQITMSPDFDAPLADFGEYME
jgi:antitoxin (DNA-binding transcriptional repressor) of toxin-antitoxin stability system